MLPGYENTKLDLALIAQLLPDVAGYDEMTDAERLEILYKARGITDDPDLNARLEREIERMEERLTRPDPKPTDEPEVNPPANESEAFFREVVWLRRDTTGPDAKVTKKLTGLQLNGNRITFDALDIPDWPAGSLGGHLKGVMCVAALRNGAWSGGKFEHIRNRMTSRDLVNVNNGYIEGLSLRRGEKLRLWILSYDGTQASNYVEVTY